MSHFHLIESFQVIFTEWEEQTLRPWQGRMHSDLILQGLLRPPREERVMPFYLHFRCTPLVLVTTKQSFNQNRYNSYGNVSFLLKLPWFTTRGRPKLTHIDVQCTSHISPSLDLFWWNESFCKWTNFKNNDCIQTGFWSTSPVFHCLAKQVFP